MNNIDRLKTCALKKLRTSIKLTLFRWEQPLPDPFTGWPWVSPDIWDLIVRSSDAIPKPRVFEYGSGASTLHHLRRLIGRQGGHLVAVDHSRKWYADVVGAITRECIANDYRMSISVTEHANGFLDSCFEIRPAPTVCVTAAMLLRPAVGYDGGEGNETQFADYVRSLGHEPFDVVVVDGRARKACIDYVLSNSLVRPSGILALHDAGRGMPGWTGRETETGDADYQPAVRRMLALGASLHDGIGLFRWPGLDETLQRGDQGIPAEACILTIGAAAESGLPLKTPIAATPDPGSPHHDATRHHDHRLARRGSGRDRIGSALTLLFRPRNANAVPDAASAMDLQDRKGLPAYDPGAEAVIEHGMRWLYRAQQRSASRDGGVARHFSLVDGWSDSYPETTGYIVPTLLSHIKATGDMDRRACTERMLQWLVSLQFPEGSFPGGTVRSKPRVPVVFNTGQILLGLAAGAQHCSDEFRAPMRKAADWLIKVQDSDGAWRRFASPFANGQENTYNAHTAWGLLEAAQVDPDRGYAESALSFLRWAIRSQRTNGWVDNCCLTDSVRPLTHTLGYFLRGLVEGARHSSDAQLADGARRLADGVVSATDTQGFLPGRLDRRWKARAQWSCLTGSAQIACCLFLLHELEANPTYLQTALALNRYVRRTIAVDPTACPDTVGGVKGSFPVGGDYGRFQYLSWACKFAVDANHLELSVPPASPTNSVVEAFSCRDAG